MPGEAARLWAEQLQAWAIPPRIRQAAPESPYRLDPAAFRHQPSVAEGGELAGTPSRRVALEVVEPLGPGACVLDVGAGAGAASLALATPATGITAVDQDQGMLAAFAAAADAAGVEHNEVAGTWPGVAGEVPAADVVVCHHVAYNVADLTGFALALTDHARHRVVLEVTAVHPWQPMNRLWRALHDLDRPEGPTAEDAVAVLREAGLDPAVERWHRPADTEVTPARVAHMRRRLCLPASRDPEIAALLGGIPTRPSEIVTLWWPGRART